MKRREFLRGAAVVAATPTMSKISSMLSKVGISSSMDSYIGDTDIGRIFQEQYDKGFGAELRVRAAPNVAQLPYKYIIDELGLSKDNPLKGLYPAAGDEMSPVLFADLMKRHFADLPIDMISTEIDPAMPRSFERQLKFLEKKGALGYDVHERKRGTAHRTTEISFAIQPRGTNGFNITYKLGNEPGQFFTDEDAQGANFFRELASPFVPVHYGFIAEMLQKGYKNDRPIMLLMPDYDGVAKRYAELIGRPIRLIGDRQLVQDEEARGPMKVEYWGQGGVYEFKTGTEAGSKERPIRDIPGEVTFSRGRMGCSCNGCMENLKEFGTETHGSDYSVLFLVRPGNLDNVPEGVLRDNIKRAFRGPYIEVAPPPGFIARLGKYA
jgi:hypothetical protein